VAELPERYAPEVHACVLLPDHDHGLGRTRADDPERQRFVA
jgi:hypothetical protein